MATDPAVRPTHKDLKTLRTHLAPELPPQGRYAAHRRQSAVKALSCLLIAAIGLAACSDAGKPKQSELGFVAGFLGGVAADEPRAAVVGREVLSAGGNAMDAAVAVFFAMTVTRPSIAGLASSGQCVLFGEKAKRVEALDFTAPSGVPGAPRGMYALHAKYGSLRWEQMVKPAEDMARFGFLVSRGFARDLASASAILADNPGLARLYAGAGGRMPLEGERASQPALAATLGVIRRAPGDFYTGAFVQSYVEGARAAGVEVTAEAMRGYVPQFKETIQVTQDLLVSHFAPTPGGAVAARMWTALAAEGQYRSAAAPTRTALIAETQGKAVTQSVSGLNELPLGAAQGGASFVIADRDSNTVACAFSMGRMFGSAKVAGDTGIVVAAPPTASEALAIAPMLTVNPRVNKMYFAAAGSGGAPVPAAEVLIGLETMIAGKPLAAALAAPRSHWISAGRVASEPQIPLGYVNAFHCPEGLVSPGAEKPTNVCSVEADKRGFGLATR
jgi:gamma-glutamyltranspeptidase/glutathione hydrolase